MKPALLLLQAVAFVALCSCQDAAKSMLPKSGGHPYEVLVVADDSVAGQVVDSVLSQSADCLPQPEPLFDVSLTDSAGYNGFARLARSVVKVTVNADLFTKTRIRYDKNVWAKPQLVVYINTPSVAALRRDVQVLGGKLADLMARFEMNATISRLAASRNPRADSLVFSVTGGHMHVPVDMLSSKRGQGFVWLSNNAASGMSSICVYTYPGVDVSTARFRAMRDSVMRINIPGERAGMYMTTAAGSLSQRSEMVRRRPVTIIRGLWEMRNDAMGGPFVAHAAVDTAKNRTVVAEAFVYAPESRKRNLIRQVEAALYTMDYGMGD